MAVVFKWDLLHFVVKYETWDINFSTVGPISRQPDPFKGENGVEAQVKEARFDVSELRKKADSPDGFVSHIQRLLDDACSDPRQPPLQIRIFADGDTDCDKLFLYLLQSRLTSAMRIWWKVPYNSSRLLNIHGVLTAHLINIVKAESLARDPKVGRPFWRDSMKEVIRIENKSNILPIRLYRLIRRKSTRKMARFYSFTFTVPMRDPLLGKLGTMHTSTFQAHMKEPKFCHEGDISVGGKHGNKYIHPGFAVSQLREKRQSGPWIFRELIKPFESRAASWQVDPDMKDPECFRITFWANARQPEDMHDLVNLRAQYEYRCHHSRIANEPLERHFWVEADFGREYVLSDKEWQALEDDRANDRYEQEPPEEWDELDREHDRFANIREWTLCVSTGYAEETEQALHELEVQRYRTMAAQEAVQAAVEKAELAPQIKGIGTAELQTQRDRVRTAYKALQSALAAERYIGRKTTEPKLAHDSINPSQSPMDCPLATDNPTTDAQPPDPPFFPTYAPPPPSVQLSLPEDIRPHRRMLEPHAEQVIRKSATKIAFQRAVEARLAKMVKGIQPRTLDQQQSMHNNARAVDVQIARGVVARREAVSEGQPPVGETGKSVEKKNLLSTRRPMRS